MEAFLVSAGVVALGEMGDKTQIATVALAARYDALFAVVAGTTFGMMLADVPVVFLGDNIAKKLSMRLVHGVAAAIFAALGVLTLFNVGKLFAADFNRLRAELLSDPYFKGVPSLDPARQRTAVHFHAKDDPAEIRFQVFKLLARHALRFTAVVRDKLELLDYAIQRHRIDPTTAITPMATSCMTN